MWAAAVTLISFIELFMAILGGSRPSRVARINGARRMTRQLASGRRCSGPRAVESLCLQHAGVQSVFGLCRGRLQAPERQPEHHPGPADEEDVDTDKQSDGPESGFGPLLPD